MRHTYPRWRWPTMAALSVVAVLGGGLTAVSPAAAATSSSGPASQYGSGTQVGVCRKAAYGGPVDCPPPIPKSQLPPGAKNTTPVTQPVGNLAALVDTRTWTTGGGNTFPGADVPFGMVQWSPDTLPNRSDGGGYSFSDTTLDGYSLTHLSGPGCTAAGDVPILPMTGALPPGNPNDVVTPFSHAGEVAQAGYYSAQSNQPDTITSQFTATPHSAMGQFTFPPTAQADFLVKLMGSQRPDFASSAHIVGNNEITGSDTSGHFCGRNSSNSGESERYTVHFSIVFSQPFTASQVITSSGSDPSAVFVTFNTTSNPVIDAKVAVSYVSSANATLNWQTENPGWNFAAVKAQAQATWNNLLHKIDVYGGTYARTQEFYSLLYKDFLQPNITSDVNGQYMGADFKVHTLASTQGNQYGIYSGWDIYHSLAQLQAVLDPSAASDMAQSLVNYYSQNAILQRWGYLNLDTYVMAGDPAQAIIADYYAFGAHGFNTTQALADMLKQATTTNTIWPGQAELGTYGYLPVDSSYGCCNVYGIAASLLEYDTASFALSHFASALGDTKDAAMLLQRANDWENEFNPASNLISPRLASGSFVSGVTPTTTSNYIEGDAYEYLWDVPNDYASLFSLLGGNSTVAPMLAKYLSQPNARGMYGELTNEFDLGEQFALDYVGDPAGTQAAVNNIRNTMYLPGPSGLANNDDLGAESSQFIWEMLGMYPENPGTDTMVFASPGFPHAVIHLANGNAITISANGASPTEYYVKSLSINDQPYNKLSIPFSTLSNGATLNWGMSTTPTTWGSAPADAPPSYQAGLKPVIGFLSSQQVTVTPGGTTTLKIAARDATGTAQSVQFSVRPPAGVTVTPSSGTFQVPADGTGYQTLTVSAAPATPQTFYSMSATLTTASSSGTTSTETLNSTVLVAEPGSLLSTFNNAGISNNSDVSAASFDGGGNSYSAQALAGAGLTAGQGLTVHGVPFTWPLPAPGYPDNTIASGQRVTVNAPAGTQKIAFLGAESGGPGEGIATLHYADGTSAPFWLGFSDWTLNGGHSQPSYGNVGVASMSYRNCAKCSNGTNTVGTHVFYAALPVNPAKTLTSVTLPPSVSAGRMHIFAVGTSTQAMSPPVAASLSPATASAGQQVTIDGSGFGSTQGSGYVRFSSQGINWGAPGNVATFHVDSWSDTVITFTVPTPSGAGGIYHVTPGTVASVTVVNSAGNVSDAPVLQITPTANPADYYDNTGISPDTDQSCANYDGDGYSYSANALAEAGLTPGASVTADGVSFTWPNVAACSPDNILAAGQTMLVNGKAGATTLGLIGSSSNGGSQGTITINYTDGTSSTQTVSFNDWASGPGNGDVAVATMPYRNSTSGSSQSIQMYVFATTVPVNPAKTVASITFPNVSNRVARKVTAMHIFAVGLG